MSDYMDRINEQWSEHYRYIGELKRNYYAKQDKQPNFFLLIFPVMCFLLILLLR